MIINQGRVFRNLLADNKFVYFPGIFDSIGAITAANTGHKGAYMSGYSVAQSLGYPDLGMVSGSQMVQRAREITGALERWPDVRNIPVIADADNGYGDFFNVWDVTQEYMKSGVAGIHIEDQILPKSCGQIGGKRCVSIDEYIGKIKAAIDARNERGDKDFYIIARTDRIGAVGGSTEAAIDTMITSLIAGADSAWPEVPDPDNEQIKYIADKVFEYFQLNPKELPDHLKETGIHLSFNYSSNKRWGPEVDKPEKVPITFDMLSDWGYKYIFTTMPALHAGTLAVYDSLKEYIDLGAEAQWNMEERKLNHPTQSFQQWAGMVPLKMKMAEKFDPKFIEALKESKGFGSDNDPHADEVHGRVKKKK